MLQVLGQVRLEDQVARLPASLTEILDVARVQALENFPQPAVNPGLAQEIAVGVGRNGEAVRHLHTLGSQLAVHFAERGVLSPDERDIPDADLVEPSNVWIGYPFVNHRSCSLIDSGSNPVSNGLRPPIRESAIESLIPPISHLRETGPR